MIEDDFTIKETMIEVGEGHELYVQDWGNPDAKNIFMFLHGGPGGGCSNKHKKLFNPKSQRVIFFDQRGAGRSKPYGSLKDNTTDHLIEDVNVVARVCEVDRFVLVGSSWGSTLALAYSIKHPQKVKGMILRGIFTGSQQEVDALKNGVFKDFYPEVWQKFLERTPKKHQADPAAYHIKRALHSKSQQTIRESALAMAELQVSVMQLDDRLPDLDTDEFDPAPFRVEMHYMSNEYFMPDKYILKNAHKLTMPVWLIQGRYDMVCLPSAAYGLSKVLPNSKLMWVVAGHSGSDRACFDVTRTVISSYS